MFLFLFRSVLCRLGFHKWEIYKYVLYRGKQLSFKDIQYSRECEFCDKEQTLSKPKKYHPTKYVWVDNDND